MANIVITSIGNYVDVDFGIYATSGDVDGRRATYKKDDISIIWIEKDDSFIDLKMKDAITTYVWRLSFNSVSDCFVVDSIDGFAPTDNIDLYNKLNALR